MSKNEAKQETEATEVHVINVAKIATCESLSGLSTLEYHVGYEAGTKDRISIRIWKNSGGGKFNTDWVSLSTIEKVMAKVPVGEPFKAAALNPIMEGRSVNTASFLAGAILAEGLIVRTEGARTYELQDWTKWRLSIAALAEAGTNMTVAPIVKTVGHSTTGADAGAAAGAGTVQAKSGKKQKPAATSPATTS
jgi:hypothetical protein